MRSKFWLVLCCVLGLIGYAASAWAQVFEEVKPVKTSLVVPQKLMRGPFHTLDPMTDNDGVTNYYKVLSKFGQFNVTGTLALHKLVHELPAIDKMIKLEEDKTFHDSVAKSGDNTWRGIKNLVSDPGGTLERTAQGLGSLFDRAGEVIRSKRSKAEDSGFEQLVGYSESKREVAFKFGVDVYSRNKVLQTHLSRLAQADYGGSLSVFAALSFVPGVGGAALTVSGTTRLLSDLISKSPPVELRLRNRKTLQKMGVDSDLAGLFIDNPNFSPRDQTILCEALNIMNGVENRSLFVKVALQTQNQDVAAMISAMAALFAAYHKNITPLKRFYPLARVLMAANQKGGMVVNIPADYLIWSRRSNSSLTSLDKTAKESGHNGPRELWLVGKLSPMAKKELLKRKWQIHENCARELLPKGSEVLK
jgi:hypothetical protein